MCREQDENIAAGNTDKRLTTAASPAPAQTCTVPPRLTQVEVSVYDGQGKAVGRVIGSPLIETKPEVRPFMLDIGFNSFANTS